MIYKIAKVLLFLAIAYYSWSWLVLPLWFVGYRIIIWLMERGLNLEYINGEDLLFLWEYPNTPNTIVTSIKMERISEKEFKDQFVERILQFKRMRQIVVNILNEAFWKEIPKEQCLTQVHFINKLHDEAELSYFKQGLFTGNLPFDRPLWEVYFQEQFGQNQSVIIIRFHHSLGDGSSLLVMFSQILNDKNILKDYRERSPKLSFWQKIMMVLMAPVNQIRVLPKMDKTIPNSLKGVGGMNTGRNKYSESKSFSVVGIKSALRGFQGITINDLSWALLSRAIKKYVEKYRASVSNSEKVSSITGLMGVNFRMSFDDQELGNHSVAGLINHKWEDDSIEALAKDYSKLTSKYKNKLWMKSSMYTGRFMVESFMDKDSMLKFGEKSFENCGFIFSNIIGPREKLYFNGKEIYDIRPVLPHINLGFSLLSFSYQDKFFYVMNTDESYNFKIEEVLSYIEEDLQQFLHKYS